jgi:hypothetical protein
MLTKSQTRKKPNMTNTFQTCGLAGALKSCGWRPDAGGGGNRLALDVEHDTPAALEFTSDDADFEHAVLRTAAHRPPAREKALYANSDLLGPGKWVVAPGGAPLCRFDVPKEFAAGSKGIGAESRCKGGGGPRHAWAAAVTAVARGRWDEVEAKPRALDAMADELKQAGWAASVDDGQLRVHVHLLGAYCPLTLEVRGPADVRVAAELFQWSALPSASRRAILAFAADANLRLPLVRLAIAPEGAVKRLRAEVALTAKCAFVSSGWLAAAVEAVETAVTLCARELPVLRDEALAQLVLAAS